MNLFLIPVHSQADIEIIVFCIIWRSTIAFERTCLCCTHVRRRGNSEDTAAQGDFCTHFQLKLPVILVQ